MATATGATRRRDLRHGFMAFSSTKELVVRTERRKRFPKRWFSQPVASESTSQNAKGQRKSEELSGIQRLFPFSLDCPSLVQDNADGFRALPRQGNGSGLTDGQEVFMALTGSKQRVA